MEVFICSVNLALVVSIWLFMLPSLSKPVFCDLYIGMLHHVLWPPVSAAQSYIQVTLVYTLPSVGPSVFAV